MLLSPEIKLLIQKEIVFSATRSSGPGGQNVNKVNSKVELRFSIHNSEFLTETAKEIIRYKLKNRINLSDELVLSSESERTQQGNKELVTVKFFLLLEKALTPQKKRVITMPTKASRFKRLEVKRINALKKQFRKPPEILS